MELYKKIGLGTVQFGLNYGISNTSGQTSPEEVQNILDYCQTIGIQLLDTAYGYGDSEKVLGQNSLNAFKVVTKFLPSEESPDIAHQFKISVQRLNTNSVYGYLAHRPTVVFEKPTQWEEMKQLKAEGLVEKIGFSFNTPDEIDTMFALEMIPDLIQVPFNYFDNRFEEKMMLLKDKYDCEIHTRSAFLQGLFFANPNHLAAFFDPIKPLLEAFQKKHTNLSGSLLKFVLSKPYIDKVIVGVNTLLQLKENINGIEKAEIPVRDFEHLISQEILTPSNWPKQ